jgi:hypothetical protein
MRLLQSDAGTVEYRNGLMRFLNEYGLDATAILSLARRTEPVEYEAGEAVLRQGAFDHLLSRTWRDRHQPATP